MSIERELLKKVISGDNKGDFFVSYDLYKEIYEFLAQPEHIADVGNMVVQDPVAWKVIDGTNGEYMFSRIKPTERSYKYDVVIPLYTAPPKREPLINIYVLNAFKADDEATHPYSYWAGVEFAEKHHGIGGEE